MDVIHDQTSHTNLDLSLHYPWTFVKINNWRDPFSTKWWVLLPKKTYRASYNSNCRRWRGCISTTGWKAALRIKLIQVKAGRETGRLEAALWTDVGVRTHGETDPRLVSSSFNTIRHHGWHVSLSNAWKT
jgi:hypothetical protein